MTDSENMKTRLVLFTYHPAGMGFAMEQNCESEPVWALWLAE